MNTTTTLTFRNQPRVTFADWRSAVDFAFIIAPQSNGVRVSQIGGAWTVEWTVAVQPTYVPPVPYYPPGWQYPMRVINGGAAS